MSEARSFADSSSFIYPISARYSAASAETSFEKPFSVSLRVRAFFVLSPKDNIYIPRFIAAVLSARKDISSNLKVSISISFTISKGNPRGKNISAAITSFFLSEKSPPSMRKESSVSSPPAIGLTDVRKICIVIRRRKRRVCGYQNRRPYLRLLFRAHRHIRGFRLRLLRENTPLPQ